MKKQLLQLVITRKDDNTLKIATFDKKHCIEDEYLSGADALKFIASAIKRLKAPK